MVDYLDTFIGLFSIYLVLSLIVTALTQAVSNTKRVNTKGRVIRRLLKNLVGESFSKKIQKHKKFLELCNDREKDEPRTPSYLDPGIFADILIDLKLGLNSAKGPITPVQVERAIDKLESDDTDLDNRLREFWASSGFDVTAFKQEIIGWFDRVSERSYGWHRRMLGLQLFLTGFLVAFLTNADTIHIFQQLTSNDELRTQTTQNAIAFAESIQPSASAQDSNDQSPNLNSDEREQDPEEEVDDIADSATGQQAEDDQPQNIQTSDDAASHTDDNSQQQMTRQQQSEDLLRAICIESGGANCNKSSAERARTVIQAIMPEILPVIGWEAIPECRRPFGDVECLGDEKGFWACLRFWVLKIAGWILTAFATSLGAPFWFDLLQKLIQVRGKVVPGTTKPKHEAPGAGPTTRNLIAKSALRSIEVESTEIESLDEFNSNSFGFDPVNIHWSARLSATAYLQKEEVEAFLAEFGAEGTLLENKSSHTQCLVAKTAKAGFISFRGTEQTATDWFTDLKVKLKKPGWETADVLTHTGFTDSLDTIWKDVTTFIQQNQFAEKGIPVWISGHSLGGALAALAALRLHMENEANLATDPEAAALTIGAIHTFGQPRVGDKRCTDELDKRFANKYFRMINQRDIVARVPFPDSDTLLKAVQQKIKNRKKGGDPSTEVAENYQYCHAGRVIYFNDLGRAIVDPQFWYRKLDTLVVKLEKDAIKNALKESTGDHGMTTYTGLSRSLFRFAESEPSD